jgi:hypothetical protein
MLIKKMIFFYDHRSHFGSRSLIYHWDLLGELAALSCIYGIQDKVSCAMQIQSMHET